MRARAIGQVAVGFAVALLPGLGFGADPGAPDDEPPPAGPPALTSPAVEEVAADAPPLGAAAEEAGEVNEADPDEAPAAAAPTAPVRRGLALQASFGLSDCFSEFCSEGDGGVVRNTRLALGMDLAGWYRPAPIFSAGLALHGNFYGMNDYPGLETNATWWTVEVAGRVHPLQTGSVDAFAGLGAGYLRVSATTSDDFASTDSTWQAWFVSIQGGTEVYVAPRLSVGGLLKLDVPFWQNVCSDESGGNQCLDTDDLSNEDTFPWLFWYLGASVTYHLGG